MRVLEVARQALYDPVPFSSHCFLATPPPIVVLFFLGLPPPRTTPSPGYEMPKMSFIVSLPADQPVHGSGELFFFFVAGPFPFLVLSLFFYRVFGLLSLKQEYFGFSLA